MNLIFALQQCQLLICPGLCHCVSVQLYCHDTTVLISEQLGVPHPRHPTTNTLVVMTTDFLVTHIVDGRPVDEARTVKKTAELVSRRILEKLEIERVYWAKQQTDWGIVTEREVLPVLAKNIELIHDQYHYASRTPLTAEELLDVVRLLTAEAQTSTAVLATSQIRWRKIGFVRISACACRVHFCPVGGLHPSNLTAVTLWSLLPSKTEPCMSVLLTHTTGQASACSTVELSKRPGRTTRCWSALVFYLTHPSFRRLGDNHNVSNPRWVQLESGRP